MSVLLPAEAKDDLPSGVFVCRHKAGSWNAVSADQFGEQTAIKIGKGGLKGITLSSTQVAELIDSFPISAYVSDTLDHCYSPDLSSSSSETPHKEEGVRSCKVDKDYRQRISTELVKKFPPPQYREWCPLQHPQWTSGSNDSQCVRLLGNWWDNGNCIPKLTPNRIPCKAQFASEYYGTSETRCQNWWQGRVRPRVHIYPSSSSRSTARDGTPANIWVWAMCCPSITYGWVWLLPEREQGDTSSQAWSKASQASKPWCPHRRRQAALVSRALALWGEVWVCWRSHWKRGLHCVLL